MTDIIDNKNLNVNKHLITFHGGGSDGSFMLDFLSGLKDDFRLICPTFKASPKNLNDSFSELDLYLHEQKIFEYNVYGVSLGGQLAQVFTSLYSQNTQKLILSRTCLPDKEKISRLRFKRFLLKLMPEKTLLKRLQKSFQSKDKKGLYDFSDLYGASRINKTFLTNTLDLQIYFHGLVLEDLKLSKTPEVLLIFAEKDEIFTQKDQEELKKFYHTAKTFTLKDQNHSDTLFEPIKELEMVKKFLSD